MAKGIDNIAIVGRCVSTDRLILGSIRQLPSSLVMGQAVGTAAAMALRYHGRLREIDTNHLQKKLREDGSYYLDENDFYPVSTMATGPRILLDQVTPHRR